MVILSGKMINKESLIYIVLNLQMTELFMREIYFHQKLFPVLEKVGDMVSCIEPLSQVMLHLGYEHDKNDVHDVMLLCETFQIAIPDEYKEK